MSQAFDETSLVKVFMSLNGITVGPTDSDLAVQFEHSSGLNWALPSNDGVSMSSSAGISGFKMTTKVISVTVAASATLGGNLTFYFDPAGQTSVPIKVNTDLFGPNAGPAPVVNYTLPDGTMKTTNLDDTGLATLDLTDD